MFIRMLAKHSEFPHSLPPPGETIDLNTPKLLANICREANLHLLIKFRIPRRFEN